MLLCTVQFRTLLSGDSSAFSAKRGCNPGQLHLIQVWRLFMENWEERLLLLNIWGGGVFCKGNVLKEFRQKYSLLFLQCLVFLKVTSRSFLPTSMKTKKRLAFKPGFVCCCFFPKRGRKCCERSFLYLLDYFTFIQLSFSLKIKIGAK